MTKQFNFYNLVVEFKKCLRDERGIALTEYIIIMALVVLPMVFYLFNPDNGFYKAARDQYELTTTILIFPGP